MERNRWAISDVQHDHDLQHHLTIVPHALTHHRYIFFGEFWLTWFLTEQTRSPSMSCLRVMLSVSWFPERSLSSVSVCPPRVQLYWGLSPPSEEQDTLISPWDRHSETSRGDDTGAGGTKMMFDMLTESWSSVTVSNTEQGRHCRIKSCLPWIDNCRVRFSKRTPLESTYYKCIIICVRSYQVRDTKRSITRSKGVFVLFYILNNFICFSRAISLWCFYESQIFLVHDPSAAGTQFLPKVRNTELRPSVWHHIWFPHLESFWKKKEVLISWAVDLPD